MQVGPCSYESETPGTPTKSSCVYRKAAPLDECLPVSTASVTHPRNAESTGVTPGVGSDKVPFK